MSNYGPQGDFLKSKYNLQLDNKISAGYENHGFITTYKIARHLSWCKARLIQSRDQ
jgi:hypothetical protein